MKLSKIVFLFWIIPFFYLDLDARSIIRVADFRWEESGGEFSFIPECRDWDGDGVHDCSEGELDLHLFEWEFVHEGLFLPDCSLDPLPKRRFANGQQVRIRLKVSGIKQEDPSGLREGDSIIWIECEPSERSVILYEQRIEGQGVVPDRSGKFTVNFGDFVSRTRHKDWLRVPVEFSNGTKEPIDVRANINGRLPFAGSSPTEMRCGLPLDWPNPESRCQEDEEFQYHFVVPPGITYRILALIRIPEIFDFTVDRYIDLEIEYVSNLDDLGSYILKRRSIGSAIDPNRKVATTKKPYAPGAMVNYTVYFENTGELSEDTITIIDTLDNRFVHSTLNLGKAKIIYFTKVNPTSALADGRTASGKVVRKTINISRLCNFVRNRDVLAIKVCLKDRKLRPGDLGSVSFSVRLSTSHPSFSHSTTRQKCHEIPNIAYTNFSKEGNGNIWHACESNPKICVLPRSSHNSDAP